MNYFKIIKRLIYMPLGLIKGLIIMANNKARDIENKLRFKNAIIDDGCTFSYDTKISSNAHILSGSVFNHCHVNSYTYICERAIMQNTTIGKYCSISHDVVIGLGAHPLNIFTTSPIFYRKENPLKVQLINKDLDFIETKPIFIENDVWIGARVIIMDGLTIGNGAVIAAGAIVTKDVPPYAIVGGVPAKIIKYRFNEKIINSILETKWWEKSIEEIYQSIEKLNLIITNEKT